jgi:hypothetical protein
MLSLTGTMLLIEGIGRAATGSFLLNRRLRFLARGVFLRGALFRAVSAMS